MNTRAALVLLAIACVAVLLVAPAASWLPQYTTPAAGGTPLPDHWDLSAFQLQWNLNPSTGSNITGTRAVGDVMQASFDTWTAAPGTALSISHGNDSSATSAGFSPSGGNTNLICFVCQGDFSKDAQTLAVTITTIENAPGNADGHGGKSRFVGQILDADILFNPATQFNTGGGSGQDLQTVATHEIGHFFGLEHTAVVRAIMFPFAPDVETTLGYDDVAAISNLYPGGGSSAGVIAGTVSFAGGGGVYGAHVFAQSVTGSTPIGGNVRKTPIGTLTLRDGTFRIAGVPADSYIVVAEPLDDPESPSNIQSYTQSFGGSIQTNFTTRWH
jgi:hypothetical protein